MVIQCFPLRVRAVRDVMRYRMIYIYEREQHAKQRKMLIPAFSIASLRKLVPTFHHVAYEVPHRFFPF